MTDIPAKPHLNHQSEAQRAVIRAVDARLAQAVNKISLYQGRGLSDRTVKTLIAAGIDAPERLLFMSKAELKGITGIGKAALAEINAYRVKFGIGDLS
jgi:hypothetical protein